MHGHAGNTTDETQMVVPWRRVETHRTEREREREIKRDSEDNPTSPPGVGPIGADRHRSGSDL